MINLYNFFYLDKKNMCDFFYLSDIQSVLRRILQTIQTLVVQVNQLYKSVFYTGFQCVDPTATITIGPSLSLTENSIKCTNHLQMESKRTIFMGDQQWNGVVLTRDGKIMIDPKNKRSIFNSYKTSESESHGQFSTEGNTTELSFQSPDNLISTKGNTFSRLVQVGCTCSESIEADSIVKQKVSNTHQKYVSHSTYDSQFVADQHYSIVKSVPNNFSDEIRVSNNTNVSGTRVKATDKIKNKTSEIDSDYTSYSLSAATITTEDGTSLDVLVYTKIYPQGG